MKTIKYNISSALIIILVVASVVPAAIMGLMLTGEVKSISGSVQARLVDINSTAVNYSEIAGSTDQELLVTSKALQYEAFFKRIAESNQFIADYVASQDLDKQLNENAQIYSILKRATKRNSAIEHIYLATASGGFLSWPSKEEESVNISDPRSQSWYTAAQEAGESVWLPLDEMSIICATPAYRNITLYSVVASETSLSEIYSDLSSLRGSGYPFIVDGDGNVVMMPKIKRGDSPWDSLLLSGNLYKSNISAFNELGYILSKKKNGFDILTIDGRGWYLVYAPVKGVDWMVVVAYPSEQMMVPVSFLEQSMKDLGLRMSDVLKESSEILALRYLIILAISGAIFGLVGVAISNRLRRSATCIAESARRIGEGDLERRVPVDCDIEGIAVSLESMRQAIGKRLSAAEADGYAKGVRDGEKAYLKAFDRFLSIESPPLVTGYDVDAWRIANGGNTFYDISEVASGKIALMMGKAGGEGATAAIVAATTRTILRSLASSEPSAVIKQANMILAKNADMPISCFYAILDSSSGEMVFSNAGHAPPFVVGPGGSVDTLCGDGISLGVRDDLVVGYDKRSLMSGDILVIYSEDMIEGQDFDFEHLIGVVRGAREKSAAGIIEEIKRAVKRRDGSLAVIVIKAI